MADGDGAVGAGFFLEGEQGDGLADEKRAAEDDDMFAFEFGAGAGQEFHDAGGGAGNKAGVVVLGDLAEVHRAQAIDVLGGREAPEDFEFIDLLRHGGLNQDAVNPVIGVEVVDELFELGLGDGDGRKDDATLDADLGGGLLLFLHVGDGGRVLADAHEGEAGFATGEGGDLGLEFGDDGGGDGVAVDELHGRRKERSGRRRRGRDGRTRFIAASGSRRGRRFRRQCR